MSVPRLLLAPTHRTRTADALTAAVVEVLTARGSEVRYHHLGPIGPLCAWDRWEGSAFLDPALTGEQGLVGLYDLAVRDADISLLSCDLGLLDTQDGVSWAPAEVSRLVDCPVVVVMDCRGWGAGMGALMAGLKGRTRTVNIAGAILSGVADREHLELLKGLLAEEDVPVAGFLMEADALRWDTAPPGAWGLPLDPDLLSLVAKQVDVDGLVTLAGQRGFLPAFGPRLDQAGEGPVVAVAGGKGLTPWSRDSIELLRLAGAKVQRLDLLEAEGLPPDTAGLVIAGTLWPETIPDIAMNVPLLQDISARVAAGLPTLALGGGLLLMLERVQDHLGRTSELAGVIPAEGEILWDLEQPAYVQIASGRDNLLLPEGATLTGWALTEVEIRGTEEGWDSPLRVRRPGTPVERTEGAGTDTLLCSAALVHLAAEKDMADRFVQRCREYEALHKSRSEGLMDPEV